jgi:tetratricopeptide (TPR) repeat protein
MRENEPVLLVISAYDGKLFLRKGIFYLRNVNNQALQHYGDAGERYEQAKTYHQLGRVAEEQRQWEKVQTAFSTALDIYVKYNDPHHATMVLNGLARIWKVTEETSLLLWVASTLKSTQEEVEARFRKMAENTSDEAEEQP